MLVLDRARRFIAFFGLSPFKTKFRAHRVGGICFLSAYLFAWLYFIFAYETFIQSRLAVLPAMIGLFQAVSAAATFWFLPKEKDSGFFSDKGILSALFVRENIFYQLITTFGPFYYLFSEDLEGHFMGRGLVVLFVFLPYAVLRPLFPTTRFDYAQDGKKVGKYRSLENKDFYQMSTTLIRYFYIWGKHVMGMGFNYLFFLNKIPPSDMRSWGWPLFLLNCGTVSIAVFLHTLRFKKLLRPRLSHGIYVTMAYLSFISVPFLCIKLWEEWRVGLVVGGGIFVNTRRDKFLMNSWWLLAMALVSAQRWPSLTASYFGGAFGISLETATHLFWMTHMAGVLLRRFDSRFFVGSHQWEVWNSKEADVTVSQAAGSEVSGRSSESSDDDSGSSVGSVPNME